MTAMWCAVVLAIVPQSAELDQLKSALGASEPNPKRIQAAMEKLEQAPAVGAIPLLTKEFHGYSQQFREKGREVASLQGLLDFLKENGLTLTGDLLEDHKLKLRKAEAGRVNVERVLSALTEHGPAVLTAVGALGEADAIEESLSSFKTLGQRLDELGEEGESIRGSLAAVESELRLVSDRPWQERRKFVEDRAKLRFDLVQTEDDLLAYGRYRDAIVEAVAVSMRSMRASDRSKAAKVVSAKVGKREPNLQRALYMELYAGLGEEKGASTIQKTYKTAKRAMGKQEEELDKTRKLAAQTRDALQDAAGSQTPNANGEIMLPRRLIIANEQAQADLEAASLEYQGLEKLFRSAAGAVVVAVRSQEEGEPRDRAVKWLLGEVAKEKDADSRILLARSLGRLDREDVRAHLREQMVDDKDVRVGAGCLDALASLGDTEMLSVVRDTLLVHEDWRMRVAAIDALARVPSNDSIQPLIDALNRETGRLREDAANALRQVTGQAFKMSAPVWQRWWDDNKATFDVADVQRDRLLALAPETAEDTGVTFYGISSPSSRVCFVLDISGSMREASREGGDKTKIEVAVRELKEAIRALRDGDTFSIVTFASNAERWKEKMVEYSAKEQKKIFQWIDEEVVANGATNLHGGMMEALKMAGIGTRDAAYEPAIDTIFLLSDGDPTVGEVTDTEELRRLIRTKNGLNRIRINAIAVGDEANIEFLYGIAEDSGGVFAKQ